MERPFLLLATILFLAPPVLGQGFQPLGEINENAYGPGVHSDGTGRSFQYKTNAGQAVNIFEVERDTYGYGSHSDGFGRRVVDEPTDSGVDPDWD